jgi:hypothetical protein
MEEAMAHDNQLPERTNESNERGRRLKTSSAIVADWMTLFAEMFHEGITEGMLLLYCETLKDVDPDILNKSFLRAAKTSKFRPTPAEILEAANVELELLQPPKTNYEQISAEEREAALEETKEYREKLKTFLRRKDEPKPAPVEDRKSSWIGMTAEEEAATMAGYKRYLTQEANKDAYNKAHGIPPIPRSREEQLAIYWNMPRHEREKIKKQVRP